MIFVIKLKLYERKQSPLTIWLCLWFSSIYLNEIFRFKIRKKIGVTKAVSSVLQSFCLLPLSFFFFFFYQQGLGRAQICLTVQQILEHSIKGNAIKSCSKCLYFLSRKSLRNGIGLRQDLYMSNLNTVE